MSGPHLNDPFRQAVSSVDQILVGAAPGNLPERRPTRFEPLNEAKTACALGLTIPPSLLLRVDRVIK
jgi:putative ABC transport system substrate-binding protein